MSILQRKAIVQTCKAIVKYMETQDGREDIDSLLDEAACCLTNVAQKMHDYWIRGVQEREVMEAKMAAKEYAKRHAKVTRISQREVSPLRQLDRMMKANPAAVRALIMEHLSSIMEEEPNGTVEETDEEDTPCPPEAVQEYSRRIGIHNR